MKALRDEILLDLIVPGQPAGSGSKTAQTIGPRGKEKRDRGGRLVLIYRPQSEATKPWMEKVKEWAEKAWGDRAPLEGALWLDTAFYERRPKDHFFADGRLRAEAPAFPHSTTTHDKDKMRRAICDPLTQAKVIADDKRIVDGHAWKFYADSPPYRACAVIHLGRMLHQTVEQAKIPSPVPEGQEQLA